MFSISSNAALVRRAVEQVNKQMPFAMSRTLSGLALSSQRHLREELPVHFTLRRGDFIRGSIRVELARKDNLRASIGVPPRVRSGIDEALALQEFGGIEKPNTGGNLAIPLAARPTPQAVTPPSQWPSKLKRSFRIRTADAEVLILQRVGGKKGRGRRAIIGPVQAGHDPQLKVMYRLKPDVRVPRRWNFRQTVERTVKNEGAALFAKELLAALRTAK